MYKLGIIIYFDTDEAFNPAKKLCKEILGYTEKEVQILSEKHFNCDIVKNLTLEQAKTITEIFNDNGVTLYLEDQRTDEIIFWEKDLGIELSHNHSKSHYCDEPLVSREHLVNPSTQHELEYQARVQKAQSENIIQHQQNMPKCPTCHSTNISKIGTLNRMVSVGLFGLASSKIGKTHKCNNCGMTW